MDKKVKIKDFFGAWNYVVLNGEKVTSSNIDKFELYLQKEDEENRWYATQPKKPRGPYICHDLKTGKVDWYDVME